MQPLSWPYFLHEASKPCHGAMPLVAAWRCLRVDLQRITTESCAPTCAGSIAARRTEAPWASGLQVVATDMCITCSLEQLLHYPATAHLPTRYAQEVCKAQVHLSMLCRMRPQKPFHQRFLTNRWNHSTIMSMPGHWLVDKHTPAVSPKATIPACLPIQNPSGCEQTTGTTAQYSRICPSQVSAHRQSVTCHTSMPSLSQCQYQRAGSTFTCLRSRL